jgi:protein-S-isoprenylcysteine O-methyltransferase Ste14
MEGSLRERSFFRALLRIPVPWVFVLGYLIGIALEFAMKSPGHGIAFPGIGIAGDVLFAVGAVIAGWGWLTFRKARTTTVPGQKSSQMVTWGPYRFTRNPMYVGLTIAYIGEACLLRQIAPLILLPVVVAYVNWIVIPLEESKLSEVFGAEYDAYRSRVRRWL